MPVMIPLPTRATTRDVLATPSLSAEKNIDNMAPDTKEGQLDTNTEVETDQIVETAEALEIRVIQEFTTGSMLDAKNRVGGINWMINGWIPYGLMTELMGEPGLGICILALWLMRSAVSILPLFNGGDGYGELYAPAEQHP